MREPRRLGERRVDVQIALGDLGEMSDPYLVRQALRGVDTVIHLAATIRDQPRHRIEELNGLATVRLLRAAERTGVRRFVFFSALDASAAQRTRLFRAKWLAEQAVLLLAAGDDGLRPLDRLRPLRPVGHPAAALLLPAGDAGLRRWPGARFQPIWAGDVARCVVAALHRGAGHAEVTLAGRGTSWPGRRPSPTTRCPPGRRVAGRARPLVHLPLPMVRAGLLGLRSIFGESVFATWEEAELMEVPMTTERGTADVEALGITPRTWPTSWRRAEASRGSTWDQSHSLRQPRKRDRRRSGYCPPPTGRFRTVWVHLSPVGVASRLTGRFRTVWVHFSPVGAAADG